MLDRGEPTPHDTVAAVACLLPELFSWETRYVRCETSGAQTKGALVVDRRSWATGGTTRVAVEVDDRAVRRRIVDATASLP